ncbi:MAG: hypothetical protein HFJ66_02495 [Eggerthellaceae bacterium]|nr:hypothetical protein [Eggerthellaceae bacterium]
MQVERDEMAALLSLQTIDLDIMQKTKEFEGLPQREQIMKLRSKKEALTGQISKVSKYKKDAKQRLSRVNDEDASLIKRQAGIQAAIEAAHGDFRNVEARSKELAGITRRRETVAQQQEKIRGEISKLEELEAQIQLAQEEVEVEEARLVAEFREQGGSLKNAIARLQSQRQPIADLVNPDILSLYEKTSARCGGVAIGQLDGNRCGVCRSRIEGGRLIELKSQAPLGTCPHCKRLLVIQ